MRKPSGSLLSIRWLSAAMAGSSALAGAAVVWGSLSLLPADRGSVQRSSDPARASQAFAGAVDRGLYAVVQDLRTLALSLKQTSPGLAADDIQPILYAWLDLRPDYADLDLVAGGRVRAAGNVTGVGREVSRRPWFLRAKTSGSAVAVPSPGAEGRTTFDVALPLPGSPPGRDEILVVRLSEAWLSEIQSKIAAPGRDTIGLSIVGPDGRSGAASPGDRLAVPGRDVTEQATPSGGYRDLPPSGWLAVARVPAQAAAAPIDLILPSGRNAVLWGAICLLAAGAGWLAAGRIARRLARIGASEAADAAPSRIAELRDHHGRLASRERSGVRALHEARTALARVRERLRTFEAMSGWTYWEIDTESGNVTWIDPATRSDVAAADRAVSLADLTSGIAPEDRDLMAFTMQAALDASGPHDVVLRTTGALAENGQRRLFVRFIRAEDEVPSGKPAKLHALSREHVEDARGDPRASGPDEGRDQVPPTEQRNTSSVLRQVVDGVIHDFNNVLTVVVANLGTLQRRHVLRPDQSRLVDAALAGAERGSSLTRRLVNFVRRDDAGLQETDVAVALTAFVPFLGANVLHQTSIETRVRPGLAKVLCSEKVLEAILLNLAFHVRDIGSEGFAIGADEQVPSEADGVALAAGRYVRIVLASGTPARHAGTHVRESEATRAVAALLAQIGGGFRLVADGSGGTGFLAELWLPAGDAAAGDPVSESGAPMRSLRVLLVDSDSLVRQSFADALADLGHDVVQAGSAEHALALLDESAAYDAMIADWAMPVVSGLQLAAVMTRRHPHVRVVLASPGGQVSANARGFLHIEKPFRYPDLAAVMREAGRSNTAEAA